MSKEIRDEIICYCNNINYSKISSILETNPNIDFEKFQNISVLEAIYQSSLSKQNEKVKSFN